MNGRAHGYAIPAVRCAGHSHTGQAWADQLPRWRVRQAKCRVKEIEPHRRGVRIANRTRKRMATLASVPRVRRGKIMLSLESLVVRVRGEYREMPGLGLTLAQACRLWQVDASTCESVLERLVLEEFLHKTEKGRYLSATTSRPAKSPFHNRVPLPRSA